MSGRVSVFVGGYRIGIDVKVDTQGCGLGGDVTDLRFDLRV